MSTLDLFGSAPVLLTAPDGDAWRTVDGVDRHVIGEPEWPQRYGVTPRGAVLVRPDGHVAWRSPDAGDSADLRAAIRRTLGHDV